jgi:hypothetical protein
MRRYVKFRIFKLTEIVMRVFFGEKNVRKNWLFWRGRGLCWNLRHFLFLIFVSN